MPRTQKRSDRARPFTEKSFYLGEFRGRTLGLALPRMVGGVRGHLEPVLKELEANATDLVLLAAREEDLEAMAPPPVLPADAPGLEGRVWRCLRTGARVGLRVPPDADFATSVADVALRLGVAKLVWLDQDGGLGRRGAAQSFVDLRELERLLRAGLADEAPRRVRMLEETLRVLQGGLPAVNLCTPQGLADELFTYAGSGTLFTRQRYVQVRRLCIDDYDAADDLIARGVAEGFLATRTEAQLDSIFANGFGAFVEGRHLAGIGALLPYPKAGAGEIASLYTLTRFLGEGIGGHLVQVLCDVARGRDCRFVFACTTTERVAGFFERQGFENVDADEIPDEKWHDYDAERRARVRCLRRPL